MKTHCNIIKDLLPLYGEGMLSPESTALIEEHLKECSACAEELKKQKEKTVGESGEIPYKTEAAPLKKVKKRIRKRTALIILGSVIGTLILLFAAFCLWPTSIDLGSSDTHTREDMELAVEAVKADAASMRVYKLLSLTYAGDEKSRIELDYINKYLNNKEPYIDCIAFDSVFVPPLGLGGAWDPHIYYWGWYVVKTQDGQWIVREKGYC
ncbi:MAG: zf-HC2 domain-containing protein [Clostridiales bacterium]|nr:zf-HC2 domain-containing protein [Clostridiales bacterium]